MNNNLNIKMKNCIEISNKVVYKYNELYSIMLEYHLEDNSIYEPYILDILDLIYKEYKIYNKLTLDDINILLNIFNNCNNDIDNDMTAFRFKQKIEYLKDLYIKARINKNILNIDIIPNNIEFNIFDSLISLIDIEMMKRLKYKLDNIYTDNYNDLSFINSMYKEFNESIIYQCFENNLSELIYLKCNMDTEKLPIIDIKNLIDFIDKILKIENDNYFKPADETLMRFSKIIIDKLVFEEYENNPKTLFSFIALITRLEILVELMNKDCLIELLTYCNEIKINNEFNINKIITVIKKRIK